MTSQTLFTSTKVQEVYGLYDTLNNAFLKRFKYQAEFRITTMTTGRDFSLNVQDVNEEERNWLMDATMQVLEKKFEKVVDGT